MISLIGQKRPAQEYVEMLRYQLNRGDDIIQIGQGSWVVGNPLVYHHAVLVDDENGTLGQAFEAGQIFVLDAILGNDLFVVIAQQGEIQPYLFGKCVVAEGTIGTYANDLSVLSPNLSSAVSELSPLPCSQSFQVSREIKEVKRQNDFFLFEHIAKSHFVLQGDWQ
jgi:hypothetical protein